MKQFAPERIFATVNGQSTRLPDGARQWVGGWSQDNGRQGVTEYVRADLVAENHAIAARFKRLHDVCAAILWTDMGVPALEHEQTITALSDLAEIMFMDALSKVSTSTSETPIVFGLEAQGHIPAVEAALAEGADWQEIGRRIGWDGETAKAYYQRHLDRTATITKDHADG